MTGRELEVMRELLDAAMNALRKTVGTAPLPDLDRCKLAVAIGAAQFWIEQREQQEAA